MSGGVETKKKWMEKIHKSNIIIGLSLVGDGREQKEDEQQQ